MVEVSGDYVKADTSSYKRYFGSIGNKSMRGFQRLAIANLGLVLSFHIHFVFYLQPFNTKNVYNGKNPKRGSIYPNQDLGKQPALQYIQCILFKERDIMICMIK